MTRHTSHVTRDSLHVPCDRFAKLLANHSVPTYEYSFEYRGQYSIVNLQGEQVRGGAFLNKMLFLVVSTYKSLQ